MTTIIQILSDNIGHDLVEFEVPDEFASVIEWLCGERVAYQPTKWDYDVDDLAHAKDGLTEDSWFQTRGIENYVGRVRTFQRSASEDGDNWWDNLLALQAILKLAATIACIPEHLLRGNAIKSLPIPGVPSGEL